MFKPNFLNCEGSAWYFSANDAFEPNEGPFIITNFDGKLAFIRSLNGLGEARLVSISRLIRRRLPSEADVA